MEDNNIYANFIQSIKAKFQSGQNTIIKELYKYESDLSQELIIALTKLLIRQGNILVVDNNNRKFDIWIVKWNEEKKDITIPSSKKLLFDDIKLCITLPKFNIFGLTDFFKSEKIELNTLLEEFKKLFMSAKQSIRICSPFIEWKGFEFFKDILVNRAADGMKIKLLSRQISPRENITRYKEIQKIFKIFNKFGLLDFVEIRNYHFSTEDLKLASSIHAKIIIIDKNQAYIGSGELRESSLRKNLELGVILRGEKVKELVKIFDTIFKKSEEMIFEQR